MSLDHETYVDELNIVTNRLNRYASLFIFAFGGIGSALNVLILSQRVFRTNPCAFFFLAASIANFTVIVSGLTSRMLSGWANDLTVTNAFFCKLRAFVLNASRPIGFWLILFASIDRWLLSSRNAQLRRMSSLQNAHRAFGILLAFSVILFSHVLYCHEPNRVDAPLQCYGITITCRFVTDASFTFFATFIPLVAMFIFGLLTVRNIRHSRIHTQHMHVGTIVSTANPSSHIMSNQKKTDHRLMTMLLVQVCLLLVFGMPLGIQKLYATLTVNQTISSEQIAVDNLVYTIVLLANFFANAMPFYIYTLVGGRLYRKAISKLFHIHK